VSRAIGERKLFPAVRAKSADTVVVAAHIVSHQVPTSPVLKPSNPAGLAEVTLMSLAWLSLIVLLIAIVVSCVSRMNVGVLAIAFAWIVACTSAT
jgi:hypothetical protein